MLVYIYCGIMKLRGKKHSIGFQEPQEPVSGTMAQVQPHPQPISEPVSSEAEEEKYVGDGLEGKAKTPKKKEKAITQRQRSSKKKESKKRIVEDESKTVDISDTETSRNVNGG